MFNKKNTFLHTYKFQLSVQFYFAALNVSNCLRKKTSDHPVTLQLHKGYGTVLKKTLYRLADRCQSKATCWIKMPCKLIWQQLSHCALSHLHGRNVHSARKKPWEELRLKRGKSLSGWLSVVSQIWIPVTYICINHKVKLTSCCQTTFSPAAINTVQM